MHTENTISEKENPVLSQMEMDIFQNQYFSA